MVTSSKKLNGYYTFTPDEGGMSQSFGPGDELPDWAAKQVKDEHLEGYSVGDDTDDFPVPGPGQTPGEGMSEDEKAEARKAADRKRKADARAAAKKQAEDDAALKAAQDAEAARRAEAEAQGQGGGS